MEEHNFEHSNRVRERIALVIFISVIAVAIFVVSLYFGTAKIFNVAATKVDEKAGTMEFCSSIIYSGVLVETSEEADARSNFLRDKKVYASDVRSDYIDKQSNIITVNLAELSAIENPLILDVGNKQVGIFAVQSYMPKTRVCEVVSGLKEGGSDVILCIAPRSNMLGTYDGVDAILCTKEASPSETTASTIEDTFLFRSAKIGEVGVLSISTSNVFIQKIVSE